LCREFLNDDNMEKLTTVGGKLFQTFTACSLKKFFRRSRIDIASARRTLWYCALTGMHLWRSDYGPFIRRTQLQFCRRLIIVPLSTFNHLAAEIGDPKGELVFLFCTARCGSTLLTQVVHSNINSTHSRCDSVILSDIVGYFCYVICRLL